MAVRIEVYREPDRRFCVFECPKRRGHECKVMLKPWPVSDGKTWTMIGEEDAPTLSPSINCGSCGWHGFVQNGQTVGV